MAKIVIHTPFKTFEGIDGDWEDVKKWRTML